MRLCYDRKIYKYAIVLHYMQENIPWEIRIVRFEMRLFHHTEEHIFSENVSFEPLIKSSEKSYNFSFKQLSNMALSPSL